MFLQESASFCRTSHVSAGKPICCTKNPFSCGLLRGVKNHECQFVFGGKVQEFASSGRLLHWPFLKFLHWMSFLSLENEEGNHQRTWRKTQEFRAENNASNPSCLWLL